MSASVKGFKDSYGACGSVFENIYFVSGKRTAFGKMNGTLSTVSPTDLAILSSKACLKASGIDGTKVDQVIASNIAQCSEDAFFLPRHIGLYAGAKLGVPALLSQRICGSGIEIIAQACEQIGMGKGDCILSVGTETMSRMPLVSFTARTGFALGRPEYSDMLWEALNDTAATPMGETADNLAKKYGLSRVEVDEVSLRSQQRYQKACESGFFDDEIVGVDPRGSFDGAKHLPDLKTRKYKTKTRAKESFVKDEHPRMGTMESLGKLPFVFSKSGPTTAGSASGIVDGACASIICSKEFLEENQLQAMGKIKAAVSVGVDPSLMGEGPVPAIKALLAGSGMGISEIDLFEINEAFGAQVLSCAKALEIDQEKLNINGGSIAIGHPLGATGVRLVLTLLRSLKQLDKRYGVASACIGGGQGIAMLVERV